MICEQIRTSSSGALNFPFSFSSLGSHRPLDFPIAISPFGSHRPFDFPIAIPCDDLTVLLSPLCPDPFLFQSHCRCANVLCRLTTYALYFQPLVAHPDLKAQPVELPVLQSRPFLSQSVQKGWMVHKPALSFCSLKSIYVYDTKRQNDMRMGIVSALLHRFNASGLPVRVKCPSMDRNVSTQTVLGEVF